MKKARCPVCQYEVKTTVGIEYRLYVHRVRGERCPGSGMLKRNVDDAWAEKAREFHRNGTEAQSDTPKRSGLE